MDAGSALRAAGPINLSAGSILANRRKRPEQVFHVTHAGEIGLSFLIVDNELAAADGSGSSYSSELYSAKPPESDELAVAEKGILGGERKPERVVEKLVRWVAEVKESDDNGSPLETVRSRKGNSLSRTRLYVALASAAGIPTRFVSGLVYETGKGFLFHCWAESRLGTWMPVDPCRGQVPADATHIKLAEGDSPEAMAPLAGLIGKIMAKVVEEAY